jgi:DNA-binding response OmpR family regulator
MIRVLVMDDDPAVRAWLRAVLENKGYEVREALDGRDGIELARTYRPAVVILELLMADKDGIQTIRELRRQEWSTKIIAMSGGSLNVPRDYLLSAAADLGAHQTLAKPFGREELLQAVAAVCPSGVERSLKPLGGSC